MPGRLIPFATNEIYHVFNRGIDHRPTFTDRNELRRSLEAISYYRFTSPPIRLSKLLIQSTEIREKLFEELQLKNETLIDILSFCLMPNHFHLLLRQKVDNGISKFIGNFQNSFTRYFNTKHQRVGPLFLDQFKGVIIETDEQLLHVSRYIHLNPYTSYVVKNFDDLQNYPWSSLPEYISDKNGICDTETILSNFKNKNTYKKFIEDQTDYQRKLHKIEHLLLEDNL
ncbi:MAG: hypothetical protein A3G13_02115 [Candidatus Levybacteria bacterium RIFCSPLOWO2_12_FULL_37_7]|nr:MAG: hypothetical protein A3G13_02115 [Candidatus Levybacteria bacterium RIFCSPLOWO2_12_FULL_37_7]